MIPVYFGVNYECSFLKFPLYREPWNINYLMKEGPLWRGKTTAIKYSSLNVPEGIKNGLWRLSTVSAKWEILWECSGQLDQPQYLISIRFIEFHQTMKGKFDIRDIWTRNLKLEEMSLIILFSLISSSSNIRETRYVISSILPNIHASHEKVSVRKTSACCINKIFINWLPLNKSSCSC